MPFLNNARSPRNFGEPCGADPWVGPGTYAVNPGANKQSWNIQERHQGTAKTFFQEVPLGSDVGPGSYEAAVGSFAGSTGTKVQPTSPVLAAMDRSRGAFNARGPRISPMGLVPGATEFLPSSVLENPGPGDYEISRAIGSMPVAHGVAAPPCESIGMQDAVGPGPGAYSPGLPTLHCAPAADFHSSESDRVLLESSAGAVPGPGAYDVVRGEPQGFGKGYAGFASTTRRAAFHPVETPGPGTYSENTCLADVDTAVSAFRSTTKRGTSGLQQVPGPGQYEQPGSTFCSDVRRARSSPDILSRRYHGVHAPQQLVLLRDTGGLPLCGFQTTAQRLHAEPQQAKVAPGQYSGEENMGRSINSAVMRRHSAHRKGAFGTATERFSIDHSEDWKLDPGVYQRVAVEPGAGSRQRLTPFATSQPRLPGPVSEAQTPAPGTYEVEVHQVRRANSWSMDTVSFGSGKERFDAPPDEGCPGAGSYECDAPARPRGGPLKSSTGRGAVGDMTAAGELGPGEYEIDKKNPWLRKSFNVTHAVHARTSLASLTGYSPKAAAAGTAAGRAASDVERWGLQPTKQGRQELYNVLLAFSRAKRTGAVGEPASGGGCQRQPEP